MNSKQLFQDFVSRISRTDRDEANAIGYLVFDNLFGLSRADILAGRNIGSDQSNRIFDIADRVNADEPIQYILGESGFYGRKFLVNPAVLIPRPETEELVSEIVHFARRQKNTVIKILDIGTGSGCIPITLSLEIANAQVFATDISHDALELAKKNAEKLNASVNFLHHDILTDALPWMNLDIITSNPPYIALAEKASMSAHVVNHEPHLALFVSDGDPLIFYRMIAAKAKQTLASNGLLIVEINERFGAEVKNIFLQNGFTDVSVVKDISGKDRIVRGTLS